MHQSRKEQSTQRESRKLYHADYREALMMASIEAGTEASDELGTRKPLSRGARR